MTTRLLFFTLLCLCGASSVAAKWPDVPFSEVRAYAYNRRDDDPNIFIKGRLNRSVVNKRGVALTAEQTRALIASVTGKHPDHMVAACFDAHHAFVFYDAAQKPVAWVEVCFECNDAITFPTQKNQVYDLEALHKLATELRLPLLRR